MPLLNTKTKFGLLMRLLHWLAIFGFSIQFYLVYRRDFMMDDNPDKLTYILLHKQIGVLLILVPIIMLMVRDLGGRPAWPDKMPAIQRRLSKIVHGLLYVILFSMPLTGYLMSCAGNRPVVLFGQYTLPMLIGPHEEIGHLLYQWHAGILPYVVMVLVGGHFLAALYHHFVMKDDVLKRML